MYLHMVYHQVKIIEKLSNNINDIYPHQFLKILVCKCMTSCFWGSLLYTWLNVVAFRQNHLSNMYCFIFSWQRPTLYCPHERFRDINMFWHNGHPWWHNQPRKRRGIRYNLFSTMNVISLVLVVFIGREFSTKRPIFFSLSVK